MADTETQIPHDATPEENRQHSTTPLQTTKTHTHIAIDTYTLTKIMTTKIKHAHILADTQNQTAQFTAFPQTSEKDAHRD